MLIEKILNIRPDLEGKLKDGDNLIQLLKAIVIQIMDKKDYRQRNRHECGTIEETARQRVEQKIEIQKNKILQLKEFEEKHSQEMQKIDPYLDKNGFMAITIWSEEKHLQSMITNIDEEIEHEKKIVREFTYNLPHSELSILTGLHVLAVKSGIETLMEHKLIEKPCFCILPGDYYKIKDRKIFDVLSKCIEQ